MEDSAITLRASEPEDRPRSRAILSAVGWIEPPTTHRIWAEADADWQARRYLKEIVAEADGVIAGRVALEAYRQPFAEICGLSVRPDYRRRGLGQKLTRACEREAARRGFSFLFLQTDLNNEQGHRLYSRMGFLPTARAGMLRMVKFMDCLLLHSFCDKRPLAQYSCVPIPDAARNWLLAWRDYVSEDALTFQLEGGASEYDSDGIGPALTAFSWRVDSGKRDLSLRLNREDVRDLEPGHHVEIEMMLENRGQRMESGVFQMILPPGIRVSSPETNVTQAFGFQIAPGETVTQPVVVQVEPDFDATPLHYLNYKSLPVSVETHWEGHRALLSVSLPLAAPRPRKKREAVGIEC